MKHTARLTACLLALALTSCTAAPQDMPAGTTTETATPPAQTAEPTTETPAVQDTLTPVYTTWGAAVGQDAVYSAMNIDDAGQYFATTIDFSTGEQRILCKKFGCSHADESCPAYMTAIRNGCVPEAMLLPVGDRLYWLVAGRYNESDGAYLDVSNPDGSELSMVFQFEHICLDQQEGKEKWDLAPLPFHKFKEVWNKWQTELYGCGWNSLFWDNHDLPRIVSRWGDEGQYREESAKMLATLLHGMQGTPYIYQGEELGMTNVKYELEEYRDIELFGMYKERRAQGYTHEELMESIYAKTRDNARTPMQWDTTEQAGFTTGKPWMKVNPNYIEINAAEQVDCEDSIFNYYRKLIQLRKELPVLTDGKFTMLDMDHDQIFAYLRDNGEDKLLVVCNFYGNTVDYAVSEKAENLEFLIGNYTEENMQTDVLRPYEARIYRIR